MTATAGPRPALLVALWSGGALLAVALGAAVATSVTAVTGLLGVLAASAVVAAAVMATRWALIALLFLLFSYAGWVVGHDLGLPEISQPLLLLIFAALAWRHLSRSEEFSLPGELTALLVLAVTWAASAAFAPNLDVSSGIIWDFLGYGLTVVAMVALLDRPVWLRRAVWTVVLAGGALAIINVAQALTASYGSDFAGFAIARSEGAGVFRVGGPLDPNFFGQMLVATAILAVYLALSTRDRAARALALTMFAACVGATGLTGSRGTLVGAAAGLILILLLAPIPRTLVAASMALVVIAGLVFLPAGLKARVGVPTEATFSAQVTTAKKGSEGAVRGRKVENIAALQMFEDHPLLGVGPGNYERNYLGYTQDVADADLTQRAAHSLYLGALAETGIVGTGALLGVLWLALRAAWRGRRWLRGGDALLAEGILVALASFLVASLFLHAAYPRYLWIMVGFGFVAGQLARNEVGERETATRPAWRGPGSMAAPLTAAAEAVAVEGPAVAERRSGAPGRPSRQRRRGRLPLITAAMVVAAVAFGSVVVMVTGGGDKRTTVSSSSASPTPVPADNPAARAAHCDPIIGSGRANSGREYSLTSFARSGTPIECASAQSIVLSVLNGGGTRIGEWSCTTNPAGPTVANCISPAGGRIRAGE